MTPTEQPKATDERQTAVAQELPPSDLPRTAPLYPPEGTKGTVEARREEVPPAAPPVPPRGPTAEQQRQTPSAGRWALGIALVVLGGLSWYLYGFVVAAFGFRLSEGQDFFTTLVAVVVAMLVAAVPALTCMASGWLLRSWWGLIATAVVYIAVSALLWVLAIGGGPGGMAFWTIEFALYVVVPAVVISAIGTNIGMYNARHGGQRPRVA